MSSVEDQAGPRPQLSTGSWEGTMEQPSRKQRSERARLGFWLGLIASLILTTTCGPSSSTSSRGSSKDAKKARFLAMFARGYYPGRSGQLFVVPRESEFVSGADPSLYFFM